MTTITDPMAFKALKKILLSSLREQQRALSGRKGVDNQQPLADIESFRKQIKCVVDILAGRAELGRLYRGLGRHILKRAHEKLLNEQRHTIEGERLGLNVHRPRKLLGIRQARVDNMDRLIEWCERYFGPGSYGFE